MPNKNTEENNQKYALKEFEKTTLSEGPESVNTEEEKSESRAIANSGRGMGASSGRLGSGKGLGSISKENNKTTTSADNSTGLTKGSGNLMQNSTQKLNQSILTAGSVSDNSKKVNTEDKKVEEAEVNSELEKNLETAASAPDDNDELKAAKTALNQILKASADLPENKENSKKGAGSLSQNKGAGSLSNLKSSKSLGSVNNGPKTGNQTKDSNQTNEISQEDQNLQNDFAGSLGDAGKEIVQTEDPDAAIIVEGRQLGLDSGRINGLGKYIFIDAEGKMQIKDFPFRDEQKQQTFESLEDYTSKIETPVQQHSNPKFKTAYYQGFNEGYNEGEQLKTEVANREKQKEHSSPQFVEAKMKGIEAGTLAASQNPQDKTRAAQLTLNFADYILNLDENQKQIQQKAFDTGYNEGFGGAEMAIIQSEKNQLKNPEYIEGFELGKRMGTASKNNTPITDDMKQKHDLLISEMDQNGKMTLRSKGYNHGYNKGFSDAEQQKIAEQSGNTELLKKDEHFNAGLVKGTVFMMLQAASVKDSDKILADMLKGVLNINQLLKNSYTIPHAVIQYFKNARDKNQNETQQKMFDNGFTRGYNTIYAENDQKQKSTHQKGTDKKDKPSQGEEIGKIGGEASALKEKLNLKLSRLKGLRMAINPQNAVPTVPEVTLMAQILKIDNYLEIIQRSVDKKDAVYQKDYYTAYNETYSAAQIKSSDNERVRHENEMEGSDDNSKSAFQSGLSAGRGFGVAVYNARKKTVPPEDLPQKIEAAFQKAKDKGIYFNNGFTQGYNEKIEIGAAETRSENVSESQKAGLEALEAKKSNKKEGKIYFEKGREEGFDKWYDFSKKPEDERSESPDIKWQRKKENNNAEIIEDIEDDYKELKKEPVLSYQQLAQDFINGYEAGKYKGKIFGENFLEGYRAALNGSASNPGGKARYEEGYQEGKQKAQYKNFRDQALLTLSGTKATEKPVNSKQNTESDYFYQQGYQEHVNQWIKVYTIDSGLEVSESLNSVSIDPIENNKESKDNNAGIINLNTKQKARYFIKNQSNLIQKNLKKIEPEIIEAIKKRMSEKFNVSIDDLPLSRIEAEYKSSLANFKNGYENAIQFAKEKTEKEKNNNHIYHKGFLMGFKQGAAPLPQNLSERVKQQFLNLSETENPEDLRNSSYLQGKTRGFQISVQLKNNMIDSNEIIAEMAGPEYFSGYQKGSRKGNEAAERFKTNILKGKNTKMPKLDDIKERENMNGELLSGFDTGYQQSFEKKKAEIKASRIHPTD